MNRGFPVRVLVAFALAAVLLVGVFAAIRRARPAEGVVTESPAVVRRAIAAKTPSVRPRSAAKAAKTPRAKPPLRVSALAGDDGDDRRSSEDRALARDVEKAYDEDDFELAKDCAARALRSRDSEIRQATVDTLAWFGAKALPELTPFIVDPDGDVADSAMDAWGAAVSSVEDEADRIGLLECALQVLSNEDHLESVSTDYLGTDERLAVESLLRVIEGDGTEQGVAKAKETYEFVTGEEFTDRSAAEKWLAEEYQPPEGD